MEYLPERQAAIMNVLRDRPVQTVHEIQVACGIPLATLYRDLSRLEKAGLVRKERGSVILLGSPSAASAAASRCVYCDSPITHPPAFSIHLENGQQVNACCPHCGLMFLEENPAAHSALAADFLYDKMVNVRGATFLIESEVTPCCEPSVLCFANANQAERFQRGFGGRILDFDAARREVVRLMNISDNNIA